ncbi:hypothetical protein, partial [Belnapia arida]
MTYDGAAVANGSAALGANGAATFTVKDSTAIPGATPTPTAPAPVQTTLGSGSDTLVLRISQ